MNSIALLETEDFATIERLAHEIWQQYYVPIIGEKQVAYMIKKFYCREALAAQHTEGQQFLMIYIDEKPSGYIGISRQQGGQYFLHKFYLDTKLHRKGVGSEIFKLLTAAYPDSKSIRLQVNINNFKSINFYFKCGFLIEKRYVLDIGEGYVMDDYIMVWSRK